MTPSSKPITSPSENTITDSPLSFEKVRLMFKETDKKFQETDRVVSEKFKETDKKLNKLERLFTSQWGKLVESLVEGDIVTLLKPERNKRY